VARNPKGNLTISGLLPFEREDLNAIAEHEGRSTSAQTLIFIRIGISKWAAAHPASLPKVKKR
jgi:hypothetical protein